MSSAGNDGGVRITGTVGVVAGSIAGRDIITINHGPPVQEIAETLVAVLEAKWGIPNAEKSGLERLTIIKLAQRLKPEEVLNFDQALIELKRAVDVAVDVIARGERGTNHDEFVNAVLARVAEKTRIGDFDGGASTIDEGLTELDAEYRRSRIALLEEGVKLDILRRDAVAVARRIEILVAVDDPTERPTWLPSFRERYEAFRKEGGEKGTNFSLSVAIELARRMVATAQNGSERGTAANLLGNALRNLGEREAETVRLEEAVAIYRAALTEWTRESAPLDWAMTQNNLGNVLFALGEREVGTARLQEAVTAYRDALKEWTRGRTPFDWAMTQNNLGNALRKLGEREAGTARLEEAVTAYREALKEWTRELRPVRWAMTQNNLGNVLRRIGERGAGTARLEEAVTVLREALEERTRESAPLDWAMTQNNLGSAHLAVGEREAGTARLEEAVAAFREALEERTRERVPLRWAMTQNNLGIALWRVGEREVGTARLEEAVITLRKALEERTRERGPLDWATTKFYLGNALATLGEREAGTDRLQEAVAAYDAALGELASALPNDNEQACRDNRERVLTLLTQKRA